MKKKLHAFLLFPLVVIFSKTLKGKKEDYTNFISNDKRELKNQTILEVTCKDYDLMGDLHMFFDKKSPIYDKTLIKFKLDVSVPAEDDKMFSFDFLHVVNIYHAMSMLSARIPNENIFVEFEISNYKLNETQLNQLLRYILIVFGSRKVDRLYLDIENFDEKSKESLTYFLKLLNSSKTLKFTQSRGLYVLTCEDKKNMFDIVWSKGQDIELTDFGIVYDKFGKEIKKDIKVSNSPIIALHKT
mgnify:CR=1 FL=1